jgi:phytoene/squalene synthetase
MTVTDRDEIDETPEYADAVTNAICILAAAVLEMTETGSPERARAMGEVLQAAERLKRALTPSPRLN